MPAGALSHSPVPDPPVLPNVRPEGFVCKWCCAPLSCRKRGIWLIWSSEADGDACPGPLDAGVLARIRDRGAVSACCGAHYQRRDDPMGGWTCLECLNDCSLVGIIS